MLVSHGTWGLEDRSIYKEVGAGDMDRGQVIIVSRERQEMEETKEGRKAGDRRRLHSSTAVVCGLRIGAFCDSPLQ